MSLQGRQSTLVLGLMSGTSLDGLDMALCAFSQKGERYAFELIAGETIPYQEIWKQRLSSIKDASAEKYFAMNALYGRYVAERVNAFLAGKERPAAIASHGHTVFHQPGAGFSSQIGCGATIAAVTGITTVADFRSMDVARGGQGAPLVPIGDKLLFPEYDACLNIGGIANISYDDGKKRRVAYDVCVANMLLNYLAETGGKPYDEGGRLAREGKQDRALLDRLNAIPYYSQEGAKSLGREWFERHVFPLFERSSLPLRDQLATATEHIAKVVADDLTQKKLKTVLVSGGGAFNEFLIERMKSLSQCDIILPSADIINFKEAIIFAFLGYLRLQEKVNTLSAVTGASGDSCGGAVYIG